MLDYVNKVERREFIIGTEIGIIHTLKTQNPDKKFIPADYNMICREMKLVHLIDVVNALENLSPAVKVDEDIRLQAKEAVDKMLMVPRD